MKEKIFIGAISATMVDPRLIAEVNADGVVICRAREHIDGDILFCPVTCPVASFWSTEEDAQRVALSIAHDFWPPEDGFINHQARLKEITAIAVSEVQLVMNFRFLWRRFLRFAGVRR